MPDDPHASICLRSASGSLYLLDIGAQETYLTRLPHETDPRTGWTGGWSSLRRDGEALPVLRLLHLREGAPSQFLLDLRGDGIPTIRTTSDLMKITTIGEAGFLAAARTILKRDPLAAMILTRLAAVESGFSELVDRLDGALPAVGADIEREVAEAGGWIELVAATLDDELPTPVGPTGLPLRPTTLERMHAASALPAMRRGMTASEWTRELAYDRAWRRIEAKYGMLDTTEINALEGWDMAIGVEQDGVWRYPAFQVDQGRIRPLMGLLRSAAAELDVPSETILLWMDAPTRQFGADSVPTDHLADEHDIVRAFRNHFGVQW